MPDGEPPDRGPLLAVRQPPHRGGCLESGGAAPGDREDGRVSCGPGGGCQGPGRHPGAEGGATTAALSTSAAMDETTSRSSAGAPPPGGRSRYGHFLPRPVEWEQRGRRHRGGIPERTATGDMRVILRLATTRILNDGYSMISDAIEPDFNAVHYDPEAGKKGILDSVVDFGPIQGCPGPQLSCMSDAPRHLICSTHTNPLCDSRTQAESAHAARPQFPSPAARIRGEFV